MGRHVYDLRASAALSRHNAPQDDVDNNAWNVFVAAVRAAAHASTLNIDVIAEGDLPTERWIEA